MSIPKIIHLVDPAHNVLSVWQNLHPDWQCIEWSHEGCYAYLKRYYPEAEAGYLRLTTPLQRVHYSWYYLLHRYGGVVVEGNRIPKKRIEALFLSLYDLYLIEDWFIASMPGTEFLTSALEELPTLESKWYDRFLGERSLVRNTATVMPETAFKRHPARVYQNYFHPVQNSGLNKIKVLLIGILLLLVFQLVRTVTSKEKLERLKARFSGMFSKPVDVTPVEAISSPTATSSQVVSSSPTAVESVVLPKFDTIKSISVAALEKGLNLAGLAPYVPPIKIPPLNPATPSSISFSPTSELVITPLMEEELVITI